MHYVWKHFGQVAVGLACLMAGGSTALAVVFQFSVPVKTEKGEHRAYLWVPAEARQIRGVVIGGMTLAERELVKDARVRTVCTQNSLALVFLTCGLMATDIQPMLDDLARTSGYAELRVAPLMFVGHSAGGPQAMRRTQAMPERCFGIMQYRGGIAADENWPPAGVPALALIGQFDEFGGRMRDAAGYEAAWMNPRESLYKHRALSGPRLACMAVEPGAGHFAWSDRMSSVFCLFLHKAAQARIPDWPVDAAEPVRCRDVDPGSGWLVDLDLTRPTHAAAPAATYKGPPDRAMWVFDEELANALTDLHKGLTGRKDQFIFWKDRTWVDAGVRHFFLDLNWVDDGRTLEVSPAYRDRYPATQPHAPIWADADKPAGSSKAPIRVRPVTGPLVAVGPNRLRIVFDGFPGADDMGRPTFLAYSEGCDEFRYTEQIGMFPRGYSGLKRGKQQTIDFEPISGPLSPERHSIPLKATSSAGLPVDYYVQYGPARIEKGQLVLAELPRRAKYPIEVQVVAYQFGSGVEPLVQSAAPVKQIMMVALEKPN